MSHKPNPGERRSGTKGEKRKHERTWPLFRLRPRGAALYAPFIDRSRAPASTNRTFARATVFRILNPFLGSHVPSPSLQLRPAAPAHWDFLFSARLSAGVSFHAATPQQLARLLAQPYRLRSHLKVRSSVALLLRRGAKDIHIKPSSLLPQACPCQSLTWAHRSWNDLVLYLRALLGSFQWLGWCRASNMSSPSTANPRCPGEEGIHGRSSSSSLSTTIPLFHEGLIIREISHPGLYYLALGVGPNTPIEGVHHQRTTVLKTLWRQASQALHHARRLSRPFCPSRKTFIGEYAPPNVCAMTLVLGVARCFHSEVAKHARDPPGGAQDANEPARGSAVVF